jgi:hypothetical protein
MTGGFCFCIFELIFTNLDVREVNHTKGIAKWKIGAAGGFVAALILMWLLAHVGIHF